MSELAEILPCPHCGGELVSDNFGGEAVKRADEALISAVKEHMAWLLEERDRYDRFIGPVGACPSADPFLYQAQIDRIDQQRLKLNEAINKRIDEAIQEQNETGKCKTHV
jgi:hypothetical protein